MAPEFMTEIFSLRLQGQCNLRCWSDFTLPIVRTVNYGIESIRYLGPKVWESIPANIKEVDTIERFKSGIKKWKPKSGLSRLCKTYLHQRTYMCVCVYIYVFVYMYIYIWAYMCIFLYVCVCMCVYICIYVYVCMCMCVYVYVYVYIYIYIFFFYVIRIFKLLTLISIP